MELDCFILDPIPLFIFVVVIGMDRRRRFRNHYQFYLVRIKVYLGIDKIPVYISARQLAIQALIEHNQLF